MNADSKRHYDVTILGGGLAGLTCALHCLRDAPALRVLVLERKEHPVPEAAHKVGESSVEVGATYFRRVLGLEDHLENDQIPKMGLRLFLGRGDNSAIERRLEVGGTEFPPTPSYQFDRGRFENHLGERVREAGVEFLDSAKVTEIELAPGRRSHHVVYEQGGETVEVSTRWVVDASGRAGIIKKKLGLHRECGHHANSAWIRIARRVKVDDWCGDPGWQAGYCEAKPRWQSTNHLLGEGYWIWLIPLASGSTSIGIVADEQLHDLTDFNTKEKMIAWLERHEPQLAAEIKTHADEIQDFSALKRYSMECQKMFSRDRWAIVGDAGFFIDPFYSPGNDFIALANYFVSALVSRDLAGKSNLVRFPLYNRLFNLYFTGTGLIFRDNYPLFGNHQIMPVKIAWDWMVYWTITGHLVIQGRAAEPVTYLRHMRHVMRLNDLNFHMQRHFRRWHRERPPREVGGKINTSTMKLLMDTNRALLDDLDDHAFGERFKQHVRQMETLFWEIIDYSGLECEEPVKRRSHSGVVKGGFNEVFRVAGAFEGDSSETAPRPPAAAPVAEPLAAG